MNIELCMPTLLTCDCDSTASVVLDRDGICGVIERNFHFSQGIIVWVSRQQRLQRILDQFHNGCNVICRCKHTRTHTHTHTHTDRQTDTQTDTQMHIAFQVLDIVCIDILYIGGIVGLSMTGDASSHYRLSRRAMSTCTWIFIPHLRAYACMYTYEVLVRQSRRVHYS